MDSRIFSSLRNKYGLVYGAGSYSALSEDCGFHCVWAKTAKANIKKVKEVVDTEIATFLKDGPTDEELKRSYNKYLSGIYSYMETSMGMNSLLTARAFSNLPPIEENIERAKNITAKDIMTACKKVFKPENKKLFCYIPK